MTSTFQPGCTFLHSSLWKSCIYDTPEENIIDLLVTSFTPELQVFRINEGIVRKLFSV
jgi:hypothetical protein